MKLILASQSPRRRELLSMITEDFEVRASQADEVLPEGVSPENAVMLLAERKARAVAGSGEGIPGGGAVIGADTVVEIDGRILGKPRSREECREMLGLLSGRTHRVYTGVAILAIDRQESFFLRTDVEFYPLSPGDIDWYSSLEEPYDKAGAYGIQGRGAVLVRGISGDYFNVMGLPVAELWHRLGAMGLALRR